MTRSERLPGHVYPTLVVVWRDPLWWWCGVIEGGGGGQDSQLSVNVGVPLVRREAQHFPPAGKYQGGQRAGSELGVCAHKAVWILFNVGRLRCGRASGSWQQDSSTWEAGQASKLGASCKDQQVLVTPKVVHIN